MTPRRVDGMRSIRRGGDACVAVRWMDQQGRRGFKVDRLEIGEIRSRRNGDMRLIEKGHGGH